MIERKEIIEVELRLIEAIRNSNLSFLERVLHDDLLFLAPNGQVVTKAMDLASHRAGDMVVERIDPTFEQIQLMGDTAIAIVVYDTRGVMLGNPIEGKFRYIRVWKKAPALQVIAGSCLMLN